MTDTNHSIPPLAPFNGQTLDQPDWFTQALKSDVETGIADYEGAKIAWKAWGERGAPGLILAHGGTAHKGWWDGLGPFLARQGRRVVAPDLLGMGQSDWCDNYSLQIHGEAVLAAGEDAGAFDAGTPVLAGHSFGGFMTLKTATHMGERLKAAIILDSPIRKAEQQRQGSPPKRGGKIYPDLKTALSRFRLLPSQPCENLWLVDHIARGSLKKVENGYTWWFDPGIWTKLNYERRDPEQAMRDLKCPLAFIRGEESVLMQVETWEYMKSVFTHSPFVSVPSAQHHLILDQPIAAAVAIDSLMNSWASQF